MTKHVNTGGPAFPKLRSLNNCKPGEKIATYTSDGMTLRDYFAVKAIQGLLASEVIASDEQFAEYSYKVADAMLRAREGVKAQQPEAQDAVPMQPVVLSANSCVRFKENRIVSALLDHGEKTGFSMNDIARGDFTGEERMQMAQLIGYSVSAYGCLSYASRESVAKADAAAESLAAQAKQRGA